ncbi:hypothetical protein VFPPC_14135 [Pochonia chlamydosporia 170]|uniref:Uncharacterized protein n=1 Tax=Pochonia chlamydosporia 170 TaxID=1380566 RepID=A0A179FAE5_METCM|nr:hypothetical protein VFPPC_14135 [Pochonia chlamydosporia 170]OAQ62408.1 hypothetical protein VFPPC_14135 [Pochonia chlamydosporia 170]
MALKAITIFALAAFAVAAPIDAEKKGAELYGPQSDLYKPVLLHRSGEAGADAETYSPINNLYSPGLLHKRSEDDAKADTNRRSDEERRDNEQPGALYSPSNLKIYNPPVRNVLADKFNE